MTHGTTSSAGDEPGNGEDESDAFQRRQAETIIRTLPDNVRQDMAAIVQDLSPEQKQAAAEEIIRKLPNDIRRQVAKFSRPPGHFSAIRQFFSRAAYRKNGPYAEELDKRLLNMHYAVQRRFPILDESQKADWSEWEYQVRHAAMQVEARKNEFYRARIIAVASAIIVPSLVGLNLSGTGGTAVRWTTFGFSLVAALSTAFVTLLRLPDRWLMYLRLRDNLLKIGWDLVNSRTESNAWETFTSSMGKTMDDYNATYEKVIVGAAQSTESTAPGGPHPQNADGKGRVGG